MNICKLLFSLEGRINRKYWWLGNLTAVFISVVLGSIFHFSIPHELSWGIFSIHNLTIGTLIGVCYIWMHVALNTKRWHDLDKQGVFTALNYIPIVGFFISIFILGCLKGNEDENTYGTPPV